MADFRNIQAQQRPVGGARADASIDQGLRNYMLGVYNMMAIGLAVTGLAAFAVASLAVTTDPSAAVAQMANGKMLTALGAALTHLRCAGWSCLHHSQQYFS